MIGLRIKKLRKSYGITLEEFAKLVKISSGALRDYEYGRTIPKATTIGDIARFFNVTTDSLIFGSDKKK